MRRDDYRKVLFEGLRNHRDYLAEHILRSYREAEKNSVGWEEFFKRLLEEIKGLDQEFETTFAGILNEYYKIKEFLESKGQAYGGIAIRGLRVCPDFDNPPKIEHVSIFLTQEAINELSYGDLGLLAHACSDAFGKLTNEISPKENTGKKDKPTSKTFEEYLTPDGVRILPELKRIYNGEKPFKIMAMVKALEHLQLFVKQPNMSELHKAINNDFNTSISVSAITYNNRGNDAPDAHRRNAIQTAKITIEQILSVDN